MKTPNPIAALLASIICAIPVCALLVGLAVLCYDNGWPPLACSALTVVFALLSAKALVRFNIITKLALALEK